MKTAQDLLAYLLSMNLAEKFPLEKAAADAFDALLQAMHDAPDGVIPLDYAKEKAPQALIAVGKSLDKDYMDVTMEDLVAIPYSRAVYEMIELRKAIADEDPMGPDRAIRVMASFQRTPVDVKVGELRHIGIALSYMVMETLQLLVKRLHDTESEIDKIRASWVAMVMMQCLTGRNIQVHDGNVRELTALIAASLV